ncbi:MAG: pseudouridine synthase [Bacteroidota bacterium]
MELPILFHDDQLIAIHKPAGLLVHQTNLDRGEDKDALRMLRDQIGRWVYPVHRLDKATSGVLVFGLSSEAARQAAKQFEERTVEKQYLAVVRGYTQEEALIDYPLKPLWEKKRGKRLSQPKPAQDAQTYYKRIATTELPHPVGRYETARYSLMILSPKTGRSRQLRRHMKHISHPILGDRSHGDTKHNAFIASFTGKSRLMLHAHSLALLHPLTNKPLLITAGLADEFQHVLSVLGLDTKEGFQKNPPD